MVSYPYNRHKFVCINVLYCHVFLWVWCILSDKGNPRMFPKTPLQTETAIAFRDINIFWLISLILFANKSNENEALIYSWNDLGNNSQCFEWFPISVRKEVILKYCTWIFFFYFSCITVLNSDLFLHEGLLWFWGTWHFLAIENKKSYIFWWGVEYTPWI